MSELALIRDLAIIWSAALVAGYICVRLRQPIIAGYIVAGIVLGPAGLKVISHGDQVKVLAEFGVALLLFALGVEVSLKQIFSSKYKAIIAGVGQMIFTALLGWLLVSFTGLSSDPAAGFLFGSICALSSSVVVTKVLMDRGELDSVHGHVLIPILLLQDLCLVPLIALLPAFTATGQDAVVFVLVALLKATAFVAFVFWSATRVVPPILSRVVHSNFRELFLLTIISICLLVALMSQWLGLSLALGAFLGGIMLSESAYGHQALSDLLPLKDLFSIVFFVSVGMLLDPVFIAEHLISVAAFVGLLIVGKALVGMAAAMVLTRSLRGAILAGVGLAQIGEFSFVLAMLAHEKGIINQELYNLFFAGAVVSLIAAPFLMNLFPQLIRKYFEGKNQSDRRLNEREEPSSDMANHVILCGYGRTGRNLGTVFQAYKVPFTVLELNATILGELKDKGIPAIYGDAMSRIVLLRANLRNASTLVVTIPDPVAAMTIIDTARHHNPEIQIIARAHRTEDIDIFRAAGANAVVQPEFEASIEITRLALLSLRLPDPEIQTALKSIRDKRYTIFQPDIAAPSLDQLLGLPHEDHIGGWYHIRNGGVSGKSIKHLDVRGKTGTTIVAIKRNDNLLPYPGPEFLLQNDDELYVVGNAQELKHFEEEYELPRFCPLTEETSDEISLLNRSTTR